MNKLLNVIKNIKSPVKVTFANPFPFQFKKMYLKIMQSREAIGSEGLDELDNPTWKAA
jgi:hypothetical protein